ncbi:hypothetical protein [Nostoc sp.]|uniref:hypothetical protein n=1 Tax=Nostoc sp. TaxID=1180 RepID=UPI002FF8200B
MKLLTQSGKSGNGRQEPNPEDIRFYEEAYLADDEDQTKPIGWVESDIKGEETGFLKKLPPEMNFDDSDFDDEPESDESI